MRFLLPTLAALIGASGLAAEEVAPAVEPQPAVEPKPAVDPAPKADGQTAETDDLRKTLNALQEKIDRLERTTANKVDQGDVNGIRDDIQVFRDQYARERERQTAKTRRNLTFTGVISTRYAANDFRDLYGNERNGFEIPLAQLALSGSLYRDYQEGRNLDFALSFQAVKGLPASYNLTNTSPVNVPAAPTPNANNITASTAFGVGNAYLRYNFFNTLSNDQNRLRVTVGQQTLPFGLEVQAGEELKPTLRGAQSADALGLTARQIGAIIEGDLWPEVDYGYDYRAPLLQYAIGVVNGNGPNTGDDNKYKDYIARVAFIPQFGYNSIFRQIQIGASGYWGTANQTAGAAARLLDYGERRRLGIDVSYNHTPIGVTYEYIIGRDERATGLPADPTFTVTRSEGHTLTLFYNWGDQFLRSITGQGKWDDYWPKTYQPYIRFDVWDPDTDLANNRTKLVTLGFNAFFAETTKFQLGYSLIEREFPEPTGDQEFQEVIAQFQYGF